VAYYKTFWMAESYLFYLGSAFLNCR